MGNDPDGDLTEAENENVAEQIEALLEEWKTDFEDEDASRQRLQCYIKMANGETSKNDYFKCLLAETVKSLQANMSSMKSDGGMDRTVDDSDDAIFNLEYLLEEKNDKIKYC